MADDAQIARLEERVEQLTKYLGRMETEIYRRFEDHEHLDDKRFDAALKMVEGFRADVKGDFDSIRKFFREALDAAVAIQDAKAAFIRWAIVVLCGAILVTLCGAWISNLLTLQPTRYLPVAPPLHSTQEQKERAR